jgi:hypothetical protein
VGHASPAIIVRTFVFVKPVTGVAVEASQMKKTSDRRSMVEALTLTSD